MTKTDRDQIQEMMVRYGRSIDARDYAALGDCFTRDCAIRFVSFAKDLVGSGELVEWIKTAVEPLDFTHHLFMNFIIESSGDQGSYTCAVIAQHGKDGGILTVGGNYTNKVAREGGVWRISEFLFEPKWTQGERDMVPHAPSKEAAAASS